MHILVIIYRLIVHGCNSHVTAYKLDTGSGIKDHKDWFTITADAAAPADPPQSASCTYPVSSGTRTSVSPSSSWRVVSWLRPAGAGGRRADIPGPYRRRSLQTGNDIAYMPTKRGNLYTQEVMSQVD